MDFCKIAIAVVHPAFSTMKTFSKLIILSAICISSHFQDAESAEILFYGAVGSHSTRISMFPLMEALAQKGHKVTFLSSYENFEDPNKKSNITYYNPKKWTEEMGDWNDHFSFFDVRKSGQVSDLWLGFQDFGISACQSMYSDPEYVNWVKTTKFDLVVMESAVNECAFGLVHLHQAKVIVYGTAIPFPWMGESYGLPDESSSIVDSTFDYKAFGEGMSFVQRVKNAVMPIFNRVKREWTFFPVLEQITRDGLGLEKDELPSFIEMEKNVSLVFLTSHFTIDLPRSLPPHVIPIGGNVVTKKIKPMPKEMEDFVNSAKNGFIYISFGTGVEFTTFDRDVQLEFIKALNAFPEMKFIWKASKEINETLPENVLTTKWAPQQTILGHPKIKAFISHSGMGSTAELVHFGVPAILLPVLADQDFNANVLESRGVAIKLEITTLKSHELEHAISEILNNDKYRNAMTKLSLAFRDRPSTPTETAVWWVEYILRHDNTNEYLLPLHLRQTWWKKRQIDVWLTLGAAAFIILLSSVAILWLLLKSVLNLSNGNSKNEKAKQKLN